LAVAPFICGSVADVLTTRREAVSTHVVCCPGSPSADVVSTFHALKVPAGTVTSSTAVTFACLSATFCFITSKLRNVVVNPSFSGSDAMETFIPAPSANSGPPSSAAMGFDCVPVPIVPVTLPPSKASLIDIGPWLISRERTVSVFLSSTVLSEISPIGSLAVSVTSQLSP
jgi:hypothetical protein